MTVTVDGLTPLLRELKGPAFREVNRELRTLSKGMAERLLPDVQAAVRASGAPQADKVAAATRAISDRRPTIVIGRNRPAISGFKRRGANTKGNRVSVAHGVVFGPAGGKVSTAADENFYRIHRSNTGGPVKAIIKTVVVRDAEREYLHGFQRILEQHGFPNGRWNGRG